MEKPPAVVKAKNKFLSFLPKAAKAAAAMRFEFENPPFSPGNKDKKRASLNAGNHKHKPHQMRGGFSGPITSVILEEARNKSKSSRFEMKEPTSPKISCMGQIKHKKKIVKEQKINNNSNSYKPFSSLPRDQSRKKSSSVFKNVMVTSSDVKKKGAKNHVNPRNFFSGKTKPEGRKSDASAEISRLPDRAPSLSQMKRFASSRDTLSKFDWTTAQVAPEESVNNHRRYYSDEERDYSDEEEEEEEFIIPFSAPLGVGGAGAGVALEPRKEINLWKRRTMAKPKPLQLTTSW